MRFYKYVVGFGLVAALVACGGGGGNPGTPAGKLPTDTSTTTAVAADFMFQLDKTSIVNTGSDQALLTVTALDSNRNVLADIPVSIALDGGAILSEIVGSSTDKSSTDKAGQVKAKINIGNDKSNRTINATITVSGITKIASVTVIGSHLVITPVPSTPTTGASVTLNISATDNAGTPIPDVEVTVTGTAGASGTVTTGASGNAAFTFTAPGVAGSYTVVASGLNVSDTKTILVTTPGGGSIPAVVDVVSASSLTPQPTSIAPNLTGTDVNRSKLSAKFLAAGNVGIKNMRVRFDIVPPSLGNGEFISTGASTIFTDDSGKAESDYIAGTRTSPTNGVLVRACYSKVDFTSSTDCPNSVSANLTVAGTPLSISIGDNNKLSVGLGNIAYVKQFLIQVNDSAGVAVKGALVSVSVDITHYGKGIEWGMPYAKVSVPTIVDTHLDFDPVPLPVNASKLLYPSTQKPAASENIWCINEDWNRNGFIDAGEDRNHDGAIQPRKAEIVVSYVSGNTTDENGQMLVQISYPQNMGRWLAYTLRATTSVAGSEGDASRAFVTDVLQNDVANGSFLTPPFGSEACTSSK